MTSSLKRLQNDVINYETSSDRKIAPNMYYIVCIHLENETESTGLVKKMIRTTFEKDGMPLVVYMYETNVYFLFSSLQIPNEHFMEGSHHKICSYFASTIARERDMNVSCSIVELDSRTKVLVYFQTKVYENARSKIIRLLEKSKKSKDENLSIYELVEELSKKKINWDSFPNSERFGTFNKYVSSSSGKGKLVTLSELFNLQDLSRYTDYFFT